MNEQSLLITNFPGDINVNKQFILDMCYKLEPDAMVSLWGFPVQSAMLPWVLLGLNVL